MSTHKRFDKLSPGDIIITPTGERREVETVDVDTDEGIAWIDFTDGQDAFGCEYVVEVINHV